MKKGDKFPVTIEGITVAEATITSIEDDRVTFEFPGTRAVIATRRSLTDEKPEQPTTGKDVLIEQQQSYSAPVEAPVQEVVETTPVVETNADGVPVSPPGVPVTENAGPQPAPKQVIVEQDG